MKPKQLLRNVSHISYATHIKEERMRLGL